jgi:mannose-6-phosphate isomerase-like protein (cupin superfamily)
MLPIRWCSKDEMLSKYVARFKDLHGAATGLPDSEIPGHKKTIFNVFGYEPPQGAGAVNPVGDDTRALISPRPGFSIGFLKAKPGNGPVLHNHDTNETFIPMQGTWRFIWEAEPAHDEFVDLGPYDTISFPAGIPRRFECLTPPETYEEGFLLAVNEGNSPYSEAMPGVMELLKQFKKGELPTLNGAIMMTTAAGGFGG